MGKKDIESEVHYLKHKYKKKLLFQEKKSPLTQQKRELFMVDESNQIR